MNKRLQHDLSQIGLEYNPENIYVFSRDELQFELTVPKEYPFIFKPPKLVLLPSGTVCDAFNQEWNLSSTLMEFMRINIDALKDIQLDIQIPAITNPAYLVLGSSYREEHNRDHYDSPSVFLLDKEHSDINISFANHLQLNLVSSRLPDKFDEICFDWSTLKFFSFETSLFERLICLKLMLKPGGTIYFETIHGAPGGASNPDHPRDNETIFKDFCRRAGFEIGPIIDADRVQGSFLVPMLYTGDKINTKIFIATKPRLGGKRKQTKRKRRKSRRILNKLKRA